MSDQSTRDRRAQALAKRSVRRDPYAERWTRAIHDGLDQYNYGRLSRDWTDQQFRLGAL